MPEKTLIELLKEMKANGIEQILPDTRRVVRLRNFDVTKALRTGNLPDLLTPLVVRSVYETLPDKDIISFLTQKRETVADAIAYLDAIDFAVDSTLADDTDITELTLDEKRWIFRLVMGDPEVLALFRYEEDADVGVVDTSNEVLEAA